MNGLGRRAGAGPGVQARAGCSGLWEPIWQRPEPFEAFCGCWLFLPPSPFQRLLSEPRQETSGSTPSPPTPTPTPWQVWETEELLSGQPWGRGSQEAHLHEKGTSTIHSSL